MKETRKEKSEILSSGFTVVAGSQKKPLINPFKDGSESDSSDSNDNSSVSENPERARASWGAPSNGRWSLLVDDKARGFIGTTQVGDCEEEQKETIATTTKESKVGKTSSKLKGDAEEELKSRSKPKSRSSKQRKKDKPKKDDKQRKKEKRSKDKSTKEKSIKEKKRKEAKKVKKSKSEKKEKKSKSAKKEKKRKIEKS